MRQRHLDIFNCVVGKRQCEFFLLSVSGFQRTFQHTQLITICFHIQPVSPNKTIYNEDLHLYFDYFCLDAVVWRGSFEEEPKTSGINSCATFSKLNYTNMQPTTCCSKIVNCVLSMKLEERK